MRSRSLAFILIVGLAAFSAGPAFGAPSDSETATAEPTPVVTTEDSTTAPLDEEDSPSPTPGPSDGGTSANTRPTVKDMSETVYQGETVTITLEGSDPDNEGKGNLKYEISNLNPSDKGTITLSGDTVTFEASSSKTGTATFQYWASNANATSDPGTVSLTVKERQPENQAPSAEPVSGGTVTQGQSVTFNLFGEDPDGDRLTYQIVKAPPRSQGDATVTKDGKVTFAAASDYAGSVSFTYLVSDGKAESSAATVSLIVVAPSPEPEPSSSSPSSSPGTDRPTGEPTDQPTSSSPTGGETSDPPTSSASENPTQTTTQPQSSSPEPTSTAISVPSHNASGGNGLEGGGIDRRDLGMGAVVVGASGLLFLGIRRLTLPEK